MTQKEFENIMELIKKIYQYYKTFLPINKIEWLE